MTEPEYPTLDEILQLHDQALQAYGGIPGLKDANALESALARPLNRLADADPTTLDLFDLAATYAAAIAANHAFNDGNKRTAWSSRVLSLKLHPITAIHPTKPPTCSWHSPCISRTKPPSPPGSAPIGAPHST